MSLNHWTFPSSEPSNLVGRLLPAGVCLVDVLELHVHVHNHCRSQIVEMSQYMCSAPVASVVCFVVGLVDCIMIGFKYFGGQLVITRNIFVLPFSVMLSHLPAVAN